jgi:hypothetical protein
MDIKSILMLAVGLVLVLSPIAMGTYYLKEWRSETKRLERRIRNLE